MSEIIVDKVKSNEGVVSKKINTSHSKQIDSDNSFEFFLTKFGFNTDYIQRMINIPSTCITPAFEMPTKAFFKDAVKILALVKAVLHKFRQIGEVIDRNNEKTSERKKIVRLSILNSLKKEKWEIRYHNKPN